MMAVLLAITAGGAYVGSAVIARHRAQAAADLAALAAAVHLADGTGAACTQGVRVGARHACGRHPVRSRGSRRGRHGRCPSAFGANGVSAGACHCERRPGRPAG